MIGVSSFSNEAGQCVEVKASDSFYSVNQVADLQSVKEYLARPRLFDTFVFGTSPGVVTTMDFDSTAAFRTFLSPVNWDRLKGAVGVRGTLKFHLVVAATPFHQGLAYMCFQYGISVADGNWNRGNVFNLATNLPHVRLNIAEETMATLSVPFVSNREYITVDNNVADNTLNYGVFNLGLLLGSPVVAGQTPPSYSLYVSFHDLELIGAVPYNTTNVVLQTGVVVKDSVSLGKSGVTAEANAGGVISKTLEVAADVAKAGSMIPSLSKIGGTADWMLRSLSKTASSFGFSKPNDETKWTKMVKYGYAGESQVDVPNQAFPLSPFMSNKIAVTSAIGCVDEDQMSFDNVLTKPSYIFRGQFSDASAAGDLLYGCSLSPSCFWYRDFNVSGTPNGNIGLPTNATITQNCFFPSTLCYIGDNFRMWRGSFKFRITFAKTKLHGGRVQVSYVPYSQAVSANAAPSNTVAAPEIISSLVQPSGYSEIFDLKDSSIVEFVCPYISPDPYIAFNNAMGSLTMVVVNPLRVTGNAPTAVQFMVEVCAEPGFELSVPKPSLLHPVGKSGLLAPKYQSGLEVPGPKIPLVSNLDSTSQFVIGEKFNSLKQLMMMPDWSYFEAPNASFTDFVPVPWFKTNTVTNTTPVSNTYSVSWFGSRSSRVSQLFAFANGSTAYTIHHDGANVPGITVTMRWWGNNSGATGALTDLRAPENNSFSSVFIPEEQATSRFIVPTYSKYMRIPIMRSTPAFGINVTSLFDSMTYTGEYSLAMPLCVLRNNSGGSRRFVVGRAAADDAYASQFVGPPPCVLFPTTSTNPPTNGGFSSPNQY